MKENGPAERQVRSADVFCEQRKDQTQLWDGSLRWLAAADTDPWLRTRVGEQVHFAKVISRRQQGTVM